MIRTRLRKYAISLLAAAVCAGAASAQPAPRVLFLSQFDSGTLTQRALENGMRDALGDGFNDVSFEFLNLGFLQSLDEVSVPWVQLLEMKHAGKPFDLLVGYGPRAIEVATDLRDSLDGPPILHVRAAPLPEELPPGDAGRRFLFDMEGIVASILSLTMPERVILISETRSDTDGERLDSLQRAYRDRGFAGEIELWTNRPLDEMVEAAAALRKGTVIHHVATFTDGKGRRISPYQSVARLTEASAVPVFSLEETDIAIRQDGPSGTVGGYVISPFVMGRHVGEAILALAAGEATTSDVSAMREIYDWRALRRWNLDLPPLAEGAVVLNRPPGLWTGYRTEIIVAAVAFVGLSAALVLMAMLARQRDRARASAAENASQLAAAQAAAGIGMYRRNFLTGEIDCDRRFRELFGLPPEGRVSLAQVQGRIDPRDREEVIADVLTAADPALRRSEYEGEYRVNRAENDLRWVHSRGRVSFDGPEPSFFTGAIYDVTDRREAEEARDVVLHEMAHRVKNSLALVQGIAGQTFRGATDIAKASAVFQQRLQALAAAHDFLAQTSWERARIRQIAEAALLEIAGAEGRIRLEGDDITLPPKRSVAVAMALHELVTNAVKHGALSIPSGRVDVRWALSETAGARHLDLHWRETGGPPVRRPDRMNFGLTLLCRIIPLDNDGEAELDFGTDGVSYRLSMPLDHDTAAEAQP